MRRSGICKFIVLITYLQTRFFFLIYIIYMLPAFLKTHANIKVQMLADDIKVDISCL